MNNNAAPAPLTPPDCDLRGYEFIPLHGHRLFGSDFYINASGDEFRAAMKLWWTAWQQCPAGSLPNDDKALCRFADLGRDLETWQAMRTVVLHGFVLCSDGRLYHPLLCQLAIDAYERRQRDRQRKKASRDRTRTSEDADVRRTVTVTSLSRHTDADVDVTRSSLLRHEDVTGERRGEDRRVLKKESKATVHPLPTRAANDAFARATAAGDDDAYGVYQWISAQADANHMPDQENPASRQWTINGYYADATADEITIALGLEHRIDWSALGEWLRDDLDRYGDVIVSTIKRKWATEKRPPTLRSIRYFDADVRSAAAAAHRRRGLS